MERNYSYQFDIVDKVSGPVKRIGGAFAQANLRLQSFGRGIENQGKRLGNLGSRLMNVQGLLAGSFVTAGVVTLGRELTNTLGKFERFEAVLTNTLGSSSAAQMVLQDIQDFAARTPFQVDELTESWVRLANTGFRPSMEEMTSLGDLASSTGKNFTDLSEAIIDAQVGEFERLKEFGIRASKSGDQVTFSFKGQQTQVKFTEQAIQEYLLGLGKVEGVGGAMAAISETIAGKTSNLQDRFTNLTKTFAEAVRPMLISIIDGMSSLIDRLTVVSRFIGANREQFATWGAIIIGTTGALLGFVATAKLVTGVQLMITTLTQSWKAIKDGILAARTAVLAFNFAALLNPFVWIPVAIAGIVLILVKFKTVRQWLYDFATWAWENHPFKWMIDLVDRVFPGFKDSVTKLFNQVKTAIAGAFKWLSENVLKPFEGVLNKLFGFTSVPTIELPKPEGGDEEQGSPYGRTPAGPRAPGSSTGGTGGSTISSRMSDVQGGGGKHITINIQALNQGGITVQSTTLGMGVNQVRDELQRMLLSVVNDVNYG